MRNICILLLAILTCTLCHGQAPAANFTAAQASGCAPVIINFQDQSTGSPTSWQWNFGNGVTSTLQNPSTTYFTPGTYTVTLTASNGSGSNTLTRTGFVTVYAKPTVNFSVNDSAGCAPLGVQFTDLSAAAPGTVNTSWVWDFGNGTNSPAQNPSTTYTLPANYTVSLKVTSDKGCFATVSKPAYIQISGSLQVDFSSTGVNRCRTPFPINFTNNSTGPGTLSYLWTFGDGGTSTVQNPLHTYSAPGAYSVALAVTSSNGCTDTLHKASFINIQNINTSFTAIDSVCVKSPVNFSNSSTPSPQGSAWDFGDGTTSATLSPVKTFTALGTYTVRLVNTYTYCSDSASKTIKVFPRPVSAFTGANTFQCKPPLTVNFTDASTSAVSWQWNFGDGNTSTQQSPSHTYNAYGNYTVTLIVTNANGCTDTLSQPSFVRIQKPLISFPTLPLNGCVPYTTTLSSNVNTPDNVTSYLWDFGDGNTSIQTTPTHIYSTQGNYTVKLTITTSTGCTESDSVTNAVTVGRVPTVDFTAVPNPVCTFGQVQFTAVFSEGNAFAWNFGDGSTSNVQNPVHQYTDTGRYNVNLTVTNNGCAVTSTKPAFIQSNPPIAGFRFKNDCQNRKLFFFTDTSVVGLGTPTYEWDFGDGSPVSTSPSPSHLFPGFGTYIVTLKVSVGGCTNTKTLNLNVFNETPAFTADKRVACKTATVNYTSQSNNLGNIVAYAWDFSNGITSTAQNPQIIYSASGSFTTTLITTDIYGCKDTVAQPNYIRINGPTAGYTVTNNNGCKGLKASFTSTAQSDGTNPIVVWQWKYGDGTSQTFFAPVSPQHAYNAVGSYTVQLIVTDTLGCKDSLSSPGLVNATSPKADFSVNDTLSCLGSSLNFTNNSIAQNFTMTWNFGDGSTWGGNNPPHIYPDTGYYTVKLKIVDQYGCADSLTKARYIHIQKTVAAFTVSDSLGGCTPFEVKFNNASQFYTSSLWQLGNGSSTVTNPSQVYNTAGTYDIKLTVTGRGGCTDTAIKTIRVFDASATTFSYSPFSGCKPLQLNGTVKSPANLNFTWDFGDGTTMTTTALNAVHTYNVFGNYVPKLLLSDSGNCLIPLIGIDTLRILGVNAKFGWDKRLFCDSGTVSFTDSTTFNDPVTSYAWDFGDGNPSTTTSPAHHFATPGTYTVSLTLQTQNGCTDTAKIDQLVKVVESPSVRINGDSIICQNDVVQYTGLFNRTDTSLVQWVWGFPNGASSAQQIPAAQTFTVPGTFTVQAVVTNSSGCTDTATRNLLVNPLPVITVSSPQTTLLGTPVLLPATYINNIVSYSWAPATGLSCTDCPQPLASPKFNTLYKVTVVDENGCKATGKVEVIVLCRGSLVFVPNTFSPNGDGSNDVFYVRGKGLNRVKNLRVFNRWGETVFEKQNFAVNDPSVGWDGTYKGQKLSPDVYVYQVEVFCENAEIIHFEGNVSLIR